MSAEERPESLDDDEFMEVDDDKSILHPSNDSAPHPEASCTCGLQECKAIDLTDKLDKILDPTLENGVEKQFTEFYRLISHGHADHSEYIKRLNEFRKQTHCGTAWSPGMVAFRCRTCSQAPTMSLCVDCFRNGNHENHDYNMFKSRFCGACDCGFSIIRESGHCSQHGKNAKALRADEPIPEHLLCLSRRVLPRLIFRLALSFRPSEDNVLVDYRTYLFYIRSIPWASAILRSLMVDTLTSEEYYSSQYNYHLNHPNEDIRRLTRNGLKELKKEMKKIAPLDIPNTWPNHDLSAFKASDRPLPKNFLEEFFIWLVVHGFQEPIVLFLLEFLVEDSYRQLFSRIVINHYPCIAVFLTGAPVESRGHMRDPYEQLSRRILQVSVQIYNDAESIRQLCDEEHVLHIIIYCLATVIQGSQRCLKNNTLYVGSQMVVDCDNVIFRERRLASFTGDLNAILLSKDGTKRLICDSKLLDIWIGLLSNFQTMCPHKRELYEHAPYDTGPQVSIFTIEAEFCLSPIWIILDHLRDDSDAIDGLLKCLHWNLALWFHRIGIGAYSQLDPYQMSFHIPLHRMFAALLRRAIYDGKQNCDYYDVIKVYQEKFVRQYPHTTANGSTSVLSSFLRQLMLHPLQVLSFYHQIRCNMWTRNGPMIISQAVTYICAFSYSTIDLDMFLLRYCAANISPDSFIKLLMQRFYSWNCLSFLSGPIFSDVPLMNYGRYGDARISANYYANILPEQISQMFESCLVTLIQLLTLNIHCDVGNDEQQTRQELVSLISVANRTYSYLVDMLPDRGCQEYNKVNENFSKILNDLTIYKTAQHGDNHSGNLQQGCYTLKPHVWLEEYDPIMVAYRYYQRREYQQSLERFFQQAKLESVSNCNVRSSSALWPPFKLPKVDADQIGKIGVLDLRPVIECQSLLGVVFSILYKAVYIEEISDSMMAHVIFILELALRNSLVTQQRKQQAGIEENQLGLRREENELFTGKYCYRELIPFDASCADDSRSKADAALRGRTIYSLFNEGAKVGREEKPELSALTAKWFPVVKHALDLAFESTWFPFSMAFDNCLVLIETVHSLPRDEFELLINKGTSQDSSMSTDNAKSSGHETVSEVKAQGSANDILRHHDISRATRSSESQTTNVAVPIPAASASEDVLQFEDAMDDDDDPDYVAPSDEDDDDDDLDGVVNEDDDDEFDGLDVRLGEDVIVIDDDNNGDDGDELDNMRRSDTDETTTADVNAGELDDEIDIQTRFMGFFQAIHNANDPPSRPLSTSASSTARVYRTRQTARRGGRLFTGPLASSLPRNLPLQATISTTRTESPGVSSDMTTTTTTTIGNDASGSSTNENNNDNNIVVDMDVARSISNPNNDSNNNDAGSLRQDGTTITTTTTTVTVHSFCRQQQQRQQQQLQVNESVVDCQSQQHQERDHIDTQPRSLTVLPQSDTCTTSEQTTLASQDAAVPVVSAALDFSGGSSRAVATRPPGDLVLACNTSTGVNTRPFPTTAPITSIGSFTGGSSVQSSISEAQEQQRHESLREYEANRARRQLHPSTLLNLFCTRTTHRTFQNEQRSSSGPSLSSSRLPDQQRSRRLRKEHRQHHGESILTLLLRLHAKYSHQPRSYVVEESRLWRNFDLSTRSRLGDGVHFITIVLDLICSSDLDRMKQRIEHLTDLIWPKKNDTVSVDGIKLSAEQEQQKVPTKDDSEERRRRAKERQTRLIAEFANKQRVFMEKYTGVRSSSSGSVLAAAGNHWSSSSLSSPVKAGARGGDAGGLLRAYRAAADGRACGDGNDGDDEPINLSSKSSQDQGSPSGGDQLSPSAAGSDSNRETDSIERQQSRLIQQRIVDKMATASPAVAAGARPIRAGSGARPTEMGPGAGGAKKSGDRSEAGAVQPQQEMRYNSGGDYGALDGEQRAAQAQEQRQPQYECCICGVEDSGDLANPLGQVVLLQSTSIYGHSHLRPRSQRKLPCDEMEYAKLKEETYAKYLERRIDLLCEHFSQSSWLDSINIGAEGGVHVQSCGHYLHIECHQSYIRSLDQSAERPRSTRQDQDQFLCPVCRQLANSVLPLLLVHERETARPTFAPPETKDDPIPSCSKDATIVAPKAGYGLVGPSMESSVSASSRGPVDGAGQGFELVSHEALDEQIARISTGLRNRRVPDQKELQSSAKFCSHLTKATAPQYRLVRSDASMHSLFLFLTSIARTNLECGLIIESSYLEHHGIDGQRSKDNGAHRVELSADDEDFTQKRSCFQLLFHVLALNAQKLINDQWFTGAQMWTHLTNHLDEQNRLSVKPTDSEVPLLLRDPLAMLLQFTFALSGSILRKRRNFLCLVKVLFNLTAIQSMALVLSYANDMPEFSVDKLVHLGRRVPDRASSASATDNDHDQEMAELTSSYHSRVSGRIPPTTPTVTATKRQTCDLEQVPDRQSTSSGDCGFVFRERQDQPLQMSTSGTGIVEWPRKVHKGEDLGHHYLPKATTSDPAMEIEGNFLEGTNGGGQPNKTQFEHLLALVWTNLRPLLERAKDEPLMNSVVRESWANLTAASVMSCSAADTGVDLKSQTRKESDQDDNSSATAGKDHHDHNRQPQGQSVEKDYMEMVDFIDNKVKLACLSFLRSAAFLQEHLYGFRMPKLQSMANEELALNDPQIIDSDFELLVSSLSLGDRCTSLAWTRGQNEEKERQWAGNNESTLQLAINWPTTAGENGERLVASWSQELLKFAQKFSIAARTLLVCRPLFWYRPALMQLPHSFDDIFMYYYSKNCSSCRAVPKDVAVCLVCGTPICFRVSCCKDRSRNRQLHTQHCGANTAVFLAVHTSSIVVIRGQRACVWGSVYLDAHEEEDNGLQRGKPLYLVPARLRLLERQWLAHSFDHTCGKRWIYLQEA